MQLQTMSTNAVISTSLLWVISHKENYHLHMSLSYVLVYFFHTKLLLSIFYIVHFFYLRFGQRKIVQSHMLSSFLLTKYLLIIVRNVGRTKLEFYTFYSSLK